jgi:pimeloyl-ACP methyl ester carboxylesterase
VIAPTAIRADSPCVVLVCLPGGFLSRRYFDLEADTDAGTDRRFSFAAAMAREGFVTLAIDHLGVGESSKPDPIEGGYALGVEEIAKANQRALELALAKLAAGDPDHEIPAITNPQTFGVGHSMGSSLTVEQQAIASPHRGLVLFAFTTRGTPRFLDDAQRELAHDPARARAELGRLTRETMSSPYPPSASDSEEGRIAAFGVGTAPPMAEQALHSASTNLLGMAGLLAMIPDGYAPSARRVRVPALIALGDHDLHDDEGLAEMLPRSPEITTFVLEDCWHCHFVANTRESLFRRVTQWIQAQLARDSNGPPSFPPSPSNRYDG